MKKTFLIVMALVLCSSFLLCGDDLYGTPFKRAVEGNAYPAVNMHLNTPLLRSPMSLLFPFESFSDREVCRRPALAFPAYDVSQFRFTGMFFRTKPAGTNFIQVKESMTFQKGNSFLLVPKTFALPVYPGIQSIPKPSIQLPRPD